MPARQGDFIDRVARNDKAARDNRVGLAYHTHDLPSLSGVLNYGKFATASPVLCDDTTSAIPTASVVDTAGDNPPYLDGGDFVLLPAVAADGPPVLWTITSYAHVALNAPNDWAYDTFTIDPFAPGSDFVSAGFCTGRLKFGGSAGLGLESKDIFFLRGAVGSYTEGWEFSTTHTFYQAPGAPAEAVSRAMSALNTVSVEYEAVLVQVIQTCVGVAAPLLLPAS